MRTTNIHDAKDKAPTQKKSINLEVRNTLQAHPGKPQFMNEEKQEKDADAIEIANSCRQQNLSSGELTIVKPQLSENLGKLALSKNSEVDLLYKRNLPLVCDMSREAFEPTDLVVVVHGIGSQKTSLVDSRVLKTDISLELAAESLLCLNEPNGSRDMLGMRRVVVAAMFHTGFLLHQDQEMAEYMLSGMSKRDKLFGLAMALQSSLGDNVRLVDAILELGANPNEEENDDGALPLETAVTRKSPESFQLLLQRGADLDLTSPGSGHTPRAHAAIYGTPQIHAIIVTWDAARVNVHPSI